ncbi:MAG: hypothetical protein HN368_00255, partial [Spirochaetales bacterium]|nr:hypothetical protein [Spirochaetales bacterium]
MVLFFKYTHRMTYRERILAAITGPAVDHPPIPMWLGFHPWTETLERWQLESGISDLDVDDYFGLKPLRTFVEVEYGPFPHVEERVISQDADYIVSIDHRGITKRSRKFGESIPEWIDHPIKTEDDWKRYKEKHLTGPIFNRLFALDGCLRESADFGTPLQVGEFPWGVFGTLRDLLGAEECLLAFYDMPAMVHDIIDTYTSLWLDLYCEISRRVQIDIIHIWEDMSGKQGSLISMEMVEEFMMPSYDHITAFAEENGVSIVSVDTDGLCNELVEVMSVHGVNAFMPFEVQAGNDIEEYRRRYPELGIMGGLDKRALAKGKPEIHKELAKAER